MTADDCISETAVSLACERATRPPRERDAAHIAELTSAERDLVILRLHARGYMDVEIAPALGVGKAAVQVRRRRLGLSAVPRRARAA